MGARHADVAEFAGNLFNCTTDEGSEQLISCLREVDAIKLASVGNILTVSNAKVASYVRFYPLIRDFPQVCGKRC